MADHFLPGLESFEQSFSLPDSDPNVEFVSHFPGMNPGHPQPGSFDIHSLMGFSLENPFPDFPKAPGNSETFPELFNREDDCIVPPLTEQASSNDEGRVDRKRKAMEISTPANSPANSSPQCSDNGIRRKDSSGRERVKGNEKEEKLKEVVHVRAKRGQATDSHSLAERVRREKINERIRCLQDIVPGCSKTMGMAVMLDEIINYVQSLQNQVEFLSMKLTAASTFYDYNSETDALEALKRAKALEALKNQNGASPGLPSALFAPLDLNFGYYPQLPHNC